MSSSACDELEARGALAGYVAGTLDEPTAAEFEDHFLTCARCQASVRAGMVVRQGIPQQKSQHRTRLWLAAGSLAAAAFAGVLFWQSADSSRLRGLGVVDVAPIYLGAPVRAYETNEFALFDSAMAQYAAARYPEAAALLQRLRTAGKQDASLDFFLGASQLLAGSPAQAERAFTAVIDRGDNLYVAEAHFYRAKARLQLGKRSGALEDLGVAAAAAGGISQSARKLVQQLET